MSPVTLIPSDSALIDLDQAKSFLSIKSDEQDDIVQDLINRASDYAEQWCNRRLKARVYTNVRMAAPRTLRLLAPSTPIVTSQTITISVNGTSLTVWRTESDGDRTGFDVLVVGEPGDPRGAPGAFYRSVGWPCWGTDPYPILLSYTGGFVDTPGELIDAACLIVQNLFRQQVKQSTDINYYASPVAGSLSYSPDLSGSLIPMKAKKILDAYRWIPL